MDRALPSSQRARRVRRRWISWLLVVVAFLLAIAALRSWIRPSIDRDEIRTARVERGEVVASISAAGQVVPIEEQVVSALFDSEIVEVMAALGKQVDEGEAILWLDGRVIELELADLREQLALKENLRRSERLSLQQSLDASRSRFELLEIDLESRKAALARFRALARDGAISKDKLAERTDVLFGISSRHRVQVLEGLEEGDEVILSDTRDIAHLESIRVE